MRENNVKKKLQNGEAVIGTFLKFTDPASAEILAIAGFDFFVLDNEHVAMDRDNLVSMIRAAEASGITPLARIKENQQVEILQNLDLGLMGVQVPNVNTVEQAHQIVRSVKYGPIGVRGFSPSVRACGYGTNNIQEYIEKANRETLIVAQCETKEGLENLDEILKIPEIDVVFIGPMDLSQSLGHVGDTKHPVVAGAIKEIKEKVKAAGKVVGTTAANADAAKALIAEDCRYILLASDQGMMMKWAKATMADIREK